MVPFEKDKVNLVTNQIIALGGGGFSDEPGNPLLDKYLLEQCGKDKPKICFLPTAGGDPDDYIQRFYNSYEKLMCEPSHLALTKSHFSFTQLESLILSRDIVFVGGGSTKFLLAEWKKSGMDKILMKAWRNGIILSGMSAGAMCWFTDGFTNLKDDIFKKLNCLGILEGSFCPHFDKKSILGKEFRRMISRREIDNGYAVEDGAALHFIGTELKYAVSSRPKAKAYFVKKYFHKVSSKTIKPIYLGGKDSISNIRNKL